MKHLFIFSITLFSLIFAQNPASAQCKGNHSNDKILLIGDSWAFFMFTYSAHNKALEQYGLSDLNLYSSVNLSINGAETHTFLDPAKKQEVIDAINNNPSIEFVHISLGGNDMLGDWNVSMSTQQTDSMLNASLLRLDSIVQYILQTNPDLNIFISAYDYPNFGETATNSLHPFYDTWQNMGFPNFLEINTVLSDYMVKLQNYCATQPNVSTVDCRGLMQYHYGQTTPLTVAPYGTYPPYTAPLPGGFPDYPSPTDALGSGGYDSFHLNSNGYKLFVAYQFENYYFDAITGKSLYKISAGNTGSGSGNTSFTDTLLYAGNKNGNDLTLQLSFNTSIIPQDTILHTLQLFIQADSVTENLFSNYNFTVRVKNGFFGNNDSLETIDFTDSATAVFQSPCHYGTLAGNNYWIRIDLDSAVNNWINRNSATQIQIAFPGIPAGKALRFSSLNNSRKPFLLLNPTLLSGIAEANLSNHTSNVVIYPNPSSTGHFSVSGIDLTENNTIEVFSIDGKKLQQVRNTSSLSIDTPGFYIIRVWQNNQLLATQKVIVKK